MRSLRMFGRFSLRQSTRGARRTEPRWLEASGLGAYLKPSQCPRKFPRSSAALLGIAIAFSSLQTATAEAKQIESLEFRQAEGGASELLVRTDSPIDYKLEENWRDRQVILEFDGASIHQRAARALDTSSFMSPVSYVRPVRIKGRGVRLVVQFRESVKVDSEKSGNVVRLKIPASGSGRTSSIPQGASGVTKNVENGAAPSEKKALAGGPSEAVHEEVIRTTSSAPSDPKSPTEPAKSSSPASAASTANAKSNESSRKPASTEASAAAPSSEAGGSATATSQASASSPGADSPAPSAASGAPAGETAAAQPAAPSQETASSSGGEQSSGVSIDNSNLTQFVSTKDSKKFSGRPITLQIKDVDVTDVLHLIGEASGFNIIVGDDVRGKIANLSLIEVPWDQALDVVLQTLRLGAERNNNVLRVATLNTLTTEKTEELKAKQAAAASAPRVTRVFQVSYASPDELSSVLGKFGSGTNQGAMGASTGQAQGQSTIQVDKRTNSIIVQDIQENIERMKKLIELLDYQTPQVLVESKVIEANETFTRGVSGNIGFGFINNKTPSTSGGVSFNGGNPLDPLFGSASSGAGASALKNLVGPLGNGFGFSPALGFIPGMDRINAILQIGETEQQVKVVTAPRIVVLNKSSANILSSTPVVINQTTMLPGGGTTTTPTSIMANVSLKVTPTVTNEGSVLMDLMIDRDVPMDNSVAKRSLTTQVLVESGSTLVIGGIYTMNNIHNASGFPLLRKIPILGALFGSDGDSNSRSELFIFITPRILNEKEAGFSS